MTLVKPSSLQALVLGRSSDTDQMKAARRQPCQEIHQETDLELRLYNGSSFRLEVTGDVEIVADDGDDVAADDQQQRITFHELVGRCCRQFTLVPKSSVGADVDTPKVVISRLSNNNLHLHTLYFFRRLEG